ncbi:hypothetical protein Hanom_Chr10g00885601 [Helianthus anomalus]
MMKLLISYCSSALIQPHLLFPTAWKPTCDISCLGILATPSLLMYFSLFG